MPMKPGHAGPGQKAIVTAPMLRLSYLDFAPSRETNTILGETEKLVSPNAGYKGVQP
jgi:hypothetical protein